MLRLLIAVVVAILGLGGTLTPRPAYATTPTTLELHLERPVWKLKERMVVSGRLTAGDRPLGGAPVQVGVDGYLDDTPYRATTAPDGSYRLEFWVEDWWGFGGHSLTALFPGDPEHADSATSTIFQVAPDQVAPVTLAVDPPPGPVDPGQQVQLRGTLRNDRNEPAAGHSVLAVIDPATDARAFAKVADDGSWVIDVTVPQVAGQWSEAFPEYRIAVVFEGDWWLAPAQQDVTLTLTRPPAEPTATSSPTPTIQSATPAPAPTSATPTASATPELELPAAAPAGSWPAWLPRWTASPVFLISAGGFLAVLVGAALISHGRRV